MNTHFAIENVRIFDGETVIAATTVEVVGDRIRAVGGTPPPGVEVLDGAGATLLPGLIDAHVHTSPASLALALRFGVTTELEMQGTHTKHDRAHVTHDDALADVRSAGFGLTPPGGHPSELFPPDFDPRTAGGGGDRRPRTSPIVHGEVTSPEEAIALIPKLVASGSDYIKFMIDDGSVEGHPGLPMLDEATLVAGVREAHKHGMLTIAHTLTLEATRMAIEAGIDGLAHLFCDRPHTPEIVELIARSGAFVVPCVTLDASMIGITGEDLADDPRVARRLDAAWDRTLRASFGHYPQGRIDDVLATVRALHAAGVDLLVGTDVSMPLPFLGGLAHGASVHRELAHLVAAGLSPCEALRAATALTARRFGLLDRGRIAPGLRADLVLVDGDPTVTIDDSLNLRAIWRRGARLADGFS
ncbi:MAG: amidohydrolase family protein [Deltaproteobacteria bacterium]|nr:amidohydrolase family protein [Deltaproteobacteria bacterium]